MFEINAILIHHGTDNVGLSRVTPITLPAFYIKASSEDEAMQIAKQIICPVEFEYESLSIGSIRAIPA